MIAIVAAVHSRRRAAFSAMSQLRKRGAVLGYQPSSLGWFHRLTAHYFVDPISVDLTGKDATDQDIQTVLVLNSVKRLDIPESSVSAKGFRDIAQLSTRIIHQELDELKNHRVNPCV